MPRIRHRRTLMRVSETLALRLAPNPMDNAAVDRIRDAAFEAGKKWLRNGNHGGFVATMKRAAMAAAKKEKA